MGLGHAFPFGFYNLRVCVNNIQPGYIHTPMFDRFFAAENAGALQEPLKKHAPVGRFAKPGEVAALVLWLSSPAASFVTRESILVNEGFGYWRPTVIKTMFSRDVFIHLC